MASLLNPYLSFGGNARQAMEFYREIFGGTLTTYTFGEYGMREPAYADKIMHSTLETDKGFTLMGADVPPGMKYIPGNNIAVSVSGDKDDAEVFRTYWEKLSAGGTVSVPLEKQVWGDIFGTCEDRFGISWMINFTD